MLARWYLGTNNILVILLVLPISQTSVAHKTPYIKKPSMQYLIIKKCQQSALSSYTSAFPGFTKMCVLGIMIIIK